MKFFVSPDVLADLDLCFGIVAAYGINNEKPDSDIEKLLQAACRKIEERYAAASVKEAPELAPYREAFLKLGMNPNKFPASIEAMASRIAKKKGFPSINPVVDLGNVVSLTYLLPLGAHDMDQAHTDIAVRYSNEGDLFLPFGEKEEETLPAGELVYAVGNRIKTRRWIWRQSEQGKITEKSKNIFFPIDGFAAVNRDVVLRARDELADLLTKHFSCFVRTGYVDQNSQEFALDQE